MIQEPVVVQETDQELVAVQESDVESVAQSVAAEMDADTASLTTAADDMVSNAILEALLGSDKTQLQDESEVSQESSAAADEAAADEDSMVARMLDNVVPEHLSLMKGSRDSAEWTAFDQLAEQSDDVDDVLNWSLVVSFVWASMHALSAVVICQVGHKGRSDPAPKSPCSCDALFIIEDWLSNTS